MLTASELREVAAVTEAMDGVFEAMCATREVDINFSPNGPNLDVFMKDGTLLGTIGMVNSEAFEFVPVVSKEKK